MFVAKTEEGAVQNIHSYLNVDDAVDDAVDR